MDSMTGVLVGSQPATLDGRADAKKTGLGDDSVTRHAPFLVPAEQRREHPGERINVFNPVIHF